MRLAAILLSLFLLSASAEMPPAIKSLMKPEVYRRITTDREVMTHASLDPVEGSKTLKRYSYYGTMLVHASEALTRKALTDYPQYAKMVPYVDQSEYFPDTQQLQLEGGIWKFKLTSRIHFENRTNHWIHYRIVEGSFHGLDGDVFFESLGEKGTLVYLRGDLTGEQWPPAFVIERGAEIVFGFTGKKMRSYIESLKSEPAGPPAPTGAPTPRQSIPRSNW